MSENMIAVAFAVAAKQFFGLLPGQGLADFVAECRAIFPEAKAELASMLTDRMHETGDLPANKYVAA